MQICRYLLCCFAVKNNQQIYQEVPQHSSTKRVKNRPSLALLFTLLIGWIFGMGILLKGCYQNETPIIEKIWESVMTLTTTSIEPEIKCYQEYTFIFASYLLLGFSLLSLIFNNVFYDIRRSKSGKLPINDRSQLTETFNDWNEICAFDESVIDSYRTVGIFQVGVSYVCKIIYIQSRAQFRSYFMRQTV